MCKPLDLVCVTGDVAAGASTMEAVGVLERAIAAADSAGTPHPGTSPCCAYRRVHPSQYQALPICASIVPGASHFFISTPPPCFVLLSEEATTPPPTLCPRCAGLLHLYIHTMEMSRHPERALQAADQLRELVPDSGHLCHMPTHIDIQCGHYRDVVVGTLLFVFVAKSTS